MGVWGGGGSADLIFLGAGISLIKFGAKFGTKIKKLGGLSFCNFSDLTKGGR